MTTAGTKTLPVALKTPTPLPQEKARELSGGLNVILADRELAPDVERHLKSVNSRISDVVFRFATPHSRRRPHDPSDVESPY